MIRILTLALCLMVWLAACQVSAPVATIPTSALPTAAPTAPLTQPTIASPTADFRDASLPIPQRVDALLAQMTLAEKIGQMTQIEHNSARPEQARQYALGSVLSGGGDCATIHRRRGAKMF